MKIKSKLLAAASCLALMAPTALAGDAEDALIGKIVAAYGGDVLAAAKSLTIVSDVRNVNTGQSADPAATSVGLSKSRLVIDYENRRQSFENWTKNRGGAFLNQALFDGETGYAINHGARTSNVNANLTFGGIGGGTMRTLDTTLVKILLENRDNAIRGDEIMYGNRSHATMTFPMAGSPDLTIYVDSESGLISKMTRENPVVGTLQYIFSNHKTNDGVTYAGQSTFLVAGQPTTLTVERSVRVDADVAGEFELPSGYREQGGNIDTSEMMVRELAEGIYYAGQNGGFSIFVDAGDHFVAAGGYAALTARFDAVKTAAGVDKPLKQQIVTHHHADHIGGMGEAATLGAEFVTVAEHVAPIQAVLPAPLVDDKFELVDGSATLAGGKIQVFDISTAHSEHYLLVYVPQIGLVFSADHFSTNLEAGLPTPNNNMATFRTAVEALNLDIKGFIGAHGTRQLTMDDLRTATDGYRETECPGGRAICSN